MSNPIIDNRTREEWANALSCLQIGTGTTGQGFLDWNVRTGRVTWDAKWAELFGLPPGVASSNAGQWEKAIHPHDLSEVMEQLNEHLGGTTEIFRADYRLDPGCGQPHSIRTIGIAVSRNANGRPCRVIMTSHKIPALEYTMVRHYESPLSHNT